jgi:hypothetical protein
MLTRLTTRSEEAVEKRKSDNRVTAYLNRKKGDWKPLKRVDDDNGSEMNDIEKMGDFDSR